jgi:hypothetical protein
MLTSVRPGLAALVGSLGMPAAEVNTPYRAVLRVTEGGLVAP